ncbi:MAG: phosphoglycerate dehydrogenase [Acidobacteria bacterium]|nr:phosphoglycerate dehydrogenase [Acidobacteriota bacterium]
MKVLIADQVSSRCAEVLKEAGLEPINRPGLAPADLLSAVADVEGIIVRSDTRISEDVMKAAPRLRVVGRAGAGVDNIDVAAATRRGLVVMNAPGENTISAAEHTLSMILALARKIPLADRSMREGRWERGQFLGMELFEKTLGILGLGKVGREVASRARAFGMEVVAYDPVLAEEVADRIGVRLLPLEEIFGRADIITLHVPLTDETHHLIGREQLARCRDGVRLINVSRGGVIDESALMDAIESGKVAGAALDVFEKEPPSGSPLLGHDSVILTPHLGASTSEAQVKVAERIAEQVAGYLKQGVVVNAVNMEGIDPNLLPALLPYRDLCERLGRLLAARDCGPVTELSIEYSGAILEYPTRPLTASFVNGFLRDRQSDPVNPINAMMIAKEIGIRVHETRATDSHDFAALILVSVKGRDGSRSAAGTLFGKRDPRLVRLDEYYLDAIFRGPMLIVSNDDRPGMVGLIGAALGDAGVNIAYMSLGRDRSGGRAIAILNLDSALQDDLLKEIADIDGVLWAERVTL